MFLLLVSANASSLLSAARRAGDASYDPASAITVYYATVRPALLTVLTSLTHTHTHAHKARNELATASYLLPLTQALLRAATTSFGTLSAQRYLATIVAQDGSVNTTALDALARAPATISPGVGWREVDLRRYT